MTKKTIYSELSRIQKAISVPKTRYNSFSDFKYRNLEDILIKLKELLEDCHLVISDEIEMVGDRFYIKATATISLGENSVSNTAYAREMFSKKKMDDCQVTGTASSYARKYALNGLLLIDDNEDPDHTAGKEDQGESSKPKNQDQKKVNEEAKTEDWVKAFDSCHRKIKEVPEAKKPALRKFMKTFNCESPQDLRSLTKAQLVAVEGGVVELLK